MKLARPAAMAIPAGVCLQCFNSQQRFAFPFLVYCAHSESLALVRSAHDSATFRCKPNQLPAVLAKLSSDTGLTNAVPPAGDRL